MSITGEEQSVSASYLEMAGGSLDVAVSLFFDRGDQGVGDINNRTGGAAHKVYGSEDFSSGSKGNSVTNSVSTDFASASDSQAVEQAGSNAITPHHFPVPIEFSSTPAPNSENATTAVNASSGIWRSGASTLIGEGSNADAGGAAVSSWGARSSGDGVSPHWGGEIDWSLKPKSHDMHTNSVERSTPPPLHGVRRDERTPITATTPRTNTTLPSAAEAEPPLVRVPVPTTPEGIAAAAADAAVAAVAEIDPEDDLAVVRAENQALQKKINQAVAELVAVQAEAK
eukprot:gene5735-25808_t